MAMNGEIFDRRTNGSNSTSCCNIWNRIFEFANVTEIVLNVSNAIPLNETLDELNFRFAQSLLPFAIILGLFCFVGIVGNTFVIIVFLLCKEYRNTNFKLFVLSLATVDLLSCVTLMPAEIVKTRHFFLITDILCKVKCFFNIFAMNASAYILLIICIDRYRKVCQPLKKQIRPSLAIKLLLGVFIISLILSLPAPIMCGVTEHAKINLYNRNITVFVCAAEKKYQQNMIRYIYKFSLSMLLVMIAVALIVMYVLIMKTVVRHWGQRESGESVRFKSNRPNLQTDAKLKNLDKEKVFIQVKFDAHAQTRLKLTLKNSYETDETNRMDDEMKHLRGSSRFTLNPTVDRGRLNSDISFHARVSRFQASSAVARRLPYKTLIWFILTLVFLITFIINAGLSFMTTRKHELSPNGLFWFQVFFRIYFINNIINPIIYAWLDKRFKRSCRTVITNIKSKLKWK